MAAVINALPGTAGDVRLFLACSKTEITADNVASALAAASGGSDGDGLIVLLATTGGAGLSPAAIARPPLGPVPAGPRPLPVLGNSLLFARGATPADGGITAMYHLWKNLFTPDGIRAWGPTIRLRQPAGAAENLVKNGILDDAGAGDIIMTADPAIVEELATREDAWIKAWNRPVQKDLSDFAGNGLFTSSTDSESWICAHAIIPRYLGPLRLTPMFPPVLDKCRILVTTLRSRFGVGEPITNFNEYLTAMVSF